jgi:hypothetical protein
VHLFERSDHGFLAEVFTGPGVGFADDPIRGHEGGLDDPSHGSLQSAQLGWASDDVVDVLYRAVVSLIAKTMRAKRGLLEDGSAELGG